MDGYHLCDWEFGVLLKLLILAISVNNFVIVEGKNDVVLGKKNLLLIILINLEPFKLKGQAQVDDIWDL